MLSFDIRTLASQAAQVDGVLLPDDDVWEEGDLRPVAGVHVTGRISPAGTGRFYFSGRLDGRLETECRRCLAAAAADVSGDMHAVFADVGDVEVDDDPDVYHLDPHSAALDLRPAVREQWLLGAPAFVECRPDCKGLCPTCGADLNAGPCSCEPATEHRWDALRTHRADPS
ncbi:MAG TPA: DUF177 domain-containing protein [Gemmatimonadaceae bacterium]|nr:DUF177 domain-containing protein [Gemmatimonadaceae bacterium]